MVTKLSRYTVSTSAIVHAAAAVHTAHLSTWPVAVMQVERNKSTKETLHPPVILQKFAACVCCLSSRWQVTSTRAVEALTQSCSSQHGLIQVQHPCALITWAFQQHNGPCWHASRFNTGYTWPCAVFKTPAIMHAVCLQRGVHSDIVSIE